MPYTFITGGASSVKSTLALTLFRGENNVTFIATGRITDPEMEKRIDAHRSQRPPSWRTVEEPLDLITAVSNTDAESRNVIIDCLTFWVSNLIYEKGMDDSRILKRAEKTARYLEGSQKSVLVVSNELGMGIIPADSESRRFRRIAGEVNQLFASCSKDAYYVVSGIPLKIK